MKKLMTAFSTVVDWVWWLMDKISGLSPLSYSARQMVDEFDVRFPDRCMICSVHRYGLSHGYIGHDEPLRPHKCREAGGSLRSSINV